MVSLTFLGAAGTVTGSKFLLQSDRRRLLVDCGLFQGERAWRQRNWDPLPVDPRSIDGVVLTHAHLDHCGWLPRLVRDGYRGPILCSEGTAELVPIVLRDAAHLQEEDARHAERWGYSTHSPALPLFDTRDAERAIPLLRPVPRHSPQAAAHDFKVTLFRAGHILGASWVLVEVDGLSVAFSGDLGRADHPLLRPPEPLVEADHLVVESTYGDRHHLPIARQELGAALKRTLARGGTALLPAFAVDRTPMVLHEIAELMRAGTVPTVPIHVDSPMALRALDVYRAAIGGDDFRPGFATATDPFGGSHIHLDASVEESEKLNRPEAPSIIVSASGMATGGRVLHHLAHQLPDPRNTVILTGYQVAGTRGRDLADGALAVKIHGEYVPVRAEVVNLRGFSAHADAEEIGRWVASAPPRHTAFVVHGEKSGSDSLGHRLRRMYGVTTVVPRHGELVRLRGTEGGHPDEHAT